MKSRFPSRSFQFLYFFLLWCCQCAISAQASETIRPHIRIVDIWAYGDVVTDSTELATEQNNLRFYCAPVEMFPPDSLSYEFWLEGYDKGWFTPFPEGWYFYTNLPPGDYVFHARCRYGKGDWGPVLSHPFCIACPWWRTWWAYLIYSLLTVMVVFYIIRLSRRAILLHNQLKIAKETYQFRTNFVVQASRQFRTPISIILSVTQKLTGNQGNHLTRTDVQHLRNSCKQLIQMTEELVEFEPNANKTLLMGEGDVLEMTDVPINNLQVMVVESNPQLADVIRRDLLKYVKVEVHDGGAGFEQTLRETEPVAVVLDMQLDAKVSPYTLIRTIRSLSTACIVLISDFASKRDIIRAIRSEADDFLLKPFNCEVLTALVLKRIRMRVVTETAPKNESAEEEKRILVMDKRADKFLLERIDALISAKMEDLEFDVNALAEALNISRGQLHAKLKHYRNMPPVEYIRNRRLERAAALLRNSPQMTVQEVMLQVGMSDAPNFFKRFKQRFGVSPNQYRQQEE